MVCVRGPRDVNLEFESQRLLDALFSSSFSFSLCSGSLPKGGLRLPLEPSIKSDLAKVASLTFKVIVRMHATKVEATKGTTQEESSAIGSEEATIYRSGYDLDFGVSRVTQA